VRDQPVDEGPAVVDVFAIDAHPGVLDPGHQGAARCEVEGEAPSRTNAISPGIC
jgi:hypothetical protein